MRPTKNKVRTGQIWVDKQTGRKVKIGHKATGNRHWNVTGTNARKTHHLHEETLLKYYEEAKDES